MKKLKKLWNFFWIPDIENPSGGNRDFLNKLVCLRKYYPKLIWKWVGLTFILFFATDFTRYWTDSMFQPWKTVLEFLVLLFCFGAIIAFFGCFFLTTVRMFVKRRD